MNGLKVILVVLGVLLPLAQARASCACEEGSLEFEILPIDGAVSVPLDARIWVFGPQCASLVRVVLGETEVNEVTKAGHSNKLFSADPGDLQPETEYQYKLVFKADEGGAEQELGPFSFTTGTANDQLPPTPEPTELTGEHLPELTDPIDNEDLCLAVLRRQDCYDTPSPAYGMYYIDEPAMTDATAFYMTQRVTKGSDAVDDQHAFSTPMVCGPMIISSASEGPDNTSFRVPATTCFQMRAYNLAGVASAPEVICGEAPSEEPQSNDSGCALGATSPRAPLAMLALLALALTALRRRSRT